MEKTLLNQNARSRAKLSKLLDNPQAIEALRTEMSEISYALNSLTIASDYQFGEFLDKVINCASKFPPSFVHYRLLPELVKCLELGKGGVRALTTIIEFGKDLPVSDYQKTISPVIVSLYASPDRVVRLKLLQSLPDYIEFLDSKTVSNKIFSHLATGFSDTEPVIREQSLKSVLFIIDKLTSKQVNGDLLRLLAKTQNDSIPEIRANTTILLGRISEKFSPSTRSSVLVAAYTRALRDPHVPSRLAALLALAASADYFSPEECCSKLMGALCPSLLDKDQSVRDQALLTLDVFLVKIKGQVEIMNANNNNNEKEALGGGLTSDLTSHISRFGLPFSLGSSSASSQRTTPQQPFSSLSSKTSNEGISTERSSIERLSRTSTSSARENGSPITEFNPFQPNLVHNSYDNDHWAPDNDENDGWDNVLDNYDSPRVKNTRAKPTAAAITKKVAKLSLEPEDDEAEVDEWSSWD